MKSNVIKYYFCFERNIKYAEFKYFYAVEYNRTKKIYGPISEKYLRRRNQIQKLQQLNLITIT